MSTDNSAHNIYTQEEIDKIYDDYYNALQEHLNSLAEELQCSVVCAGDVWYLRSRSRWSQELENELIRLYNAGTPPNICEFGHNVP